MSPFWSRTIETPTLEPRSDGFTTSGRPAIGEEPRRKRLMHAERARKHPRAGVRHAERFKQGLRRAVFAVFSMHGDERHVGSVLLELNRRVAPLGHDDRKRLVF